MNANERRAFLRKAGLAGVFSAMSPDVLAQAVSGSLAVEPVVSKLQPKPSHSVRFAVVGLDHAHAYNMTTTLLRGGGELAAVHAAEPQQLAGFIERFGEVKRARSEAEVLEDESIQLVVSAAVPDLRAPLGLRAMRAGKDYLAAKPAVTTLEQLEDVRRTVEETGRKFAIMYSERLEVRAAVHAGELVRQGAIGRVIQTVNLGPHRLNAPSRPAWFFDRARYGGILTDIGSHQADQFLYYTGSTRAQVVAAQAGNLAHPQYPQFEDFGDMLIVGDGGTGYLRVDWFTPDGLATWGDGRLFILGTEGYIELRKYIDVASNLAGGNHLYLVDRHRARYIDCNAVPLPFGAQFVADINERTQTAQDQDQALLAAELVLTAQQRATRPLLSPAGPDVRP